MKKPSSARKPNKNQQAKPIAAGEVRIIGGQFKRRIVRFIDAEGLRPTPDSDSHQIIQGSAEQVLQQAYLTPRPFDIVFIDPPYAQDLWQPILTVLITQSLITTETLIYLEADRDLSAQLSQLAESLNENPAFGANATQGLLGFECLKQTKVGQVVAGLYQLSSS